MENRLPGEKPSLSSETGIKNHPGIYVGVEDDGDYQTDVEEDDGLGDIWNEMSMGLETNKVSFMYILYYNNMFLCYVCMYFMFQIGKTCWLITCLVQIVSALSALLELKVTTSVFDIIIVSEKIEPLMLNKTHFPIKVIAHLNRD